jgi:hypothetical protein
VVCVTDDDFGAPDRAADVEGRFSGVRTDADGE